MCVRKDRAAGTLAVGVFFLICVPHGTKWSSLLAPVLYLFIVKWKPQVSRLRRRQSWVLSCVTLFSHRRTRALRRLLSGPLSCREAPVGPSPPATALFTALCVRGANAVFLSHRRASASCSSFSCLVCWLSVFHVLFLIPSSFGPAPSLWDSRLRPSSSHSTGMFFSAWFQLYTFVLLIVLAW